MHTQPSPQVHLVFGRCSLRLTGYRNLTTFLESITQVTELNCMAGKPATIANEAQSDAEIDMESSYSQSRRVTSAAAMTRREGPSNLSPRLEQADCRH